MAEHPIQGLMKTAMENLKEMIDVNTIIGDPVETPDGSVILTVPRVGFGLRLAEASSAAINRPNPKRAMETANEKNRSSRLAGEAEEAYRLRRLLFDCRIIRR